ncbi:MAG: gliding motility-associated C-terminal domain-containing protein [Bacteroidetes bacterium]|nr:gliding motility-associated C-terminal domain-containing protein [Bacteroidota bacterium]
MLVTTSDMGCSDTVFKTISVELETDLFLPNAFTPNNDGLNDVFRLRGTQIENSSMIIVSQWGNVIYRNDDAGKGWDGTINGKYVENATYTYLVKVKKRDVPEKILKGNISLIR